MKTRARGHRPAVAQRNIDGIFVCRNHLARASYLAPEQPVTGDVESLGLACWHEREAQPLPRQTATGHASLRVTGATPAQFAVERTTDLKNWTPFATDAIGNPGQFFSDPFPPPLKYFTAFGRLSDEST